MPISLLLVLSLLLPALAAPQDDEFSEYTRDWRRLESPHFTLVGNATDGTMRNVAESLEEFRSAVLAAMPAMAESYETETTVVVFRHEAAFRPFRPEGAAGFFSTGPYRNYIALYDDPQRVIYHEYVHQLTRAGRSWPPWLREGTAEFYSTLEIRNGGRSVFLGRSIGSHIAWLERGYMDLERFLDPDTRFDSSALQQTLYAEGWALFHYFQFRRPDLIPRLNQFNQFIAESGDVAGAFEAIFETDLETFERDFATYARNTLRFPAGEKPLPERLSEVEVSRSVEIPESDASFYLGDLLLHSGRREEAREWLERAVALGGEFEPALTALHILHEESGEREEAAAFLERALGAPGAGYVPNLIAAIGSLTGGLYDQIADTAESQLRLVVGERPGLPEGHYWLGQLLLRRPQMADEALAELEAAASLSGGEPRMRLAWAEGLAATGNDLRAMGMLMGLAQTVTDPVLRERTETLLEEVRRLNAAREAQAASTAAAPSPPPRAPTGPPSTGTRPPSPPTPIVPEGMAMAEGRITYIGCLGSFQLVLVSGDGTIRLAAPDLSNVDLVSYSTAVTGEMPCGEIEPPLPARVIYRPADGEEASTDGEPLRVDFLP